MKTNLSFTSPGNFPLSILIMGDGQISQAFTPSDRSCRRIHRVGAVIEKAKYCFTCPESTTLEYIYASKSKQRTTTQQLQRQNVGVEPKIIGKPPKSSICS